MPPRKRAASAPKAEPGQEPLAPEDEADGQQADAATDESTPDSDDAAAPAGDLQAVDKPHEECFPNGWPEGAFSVGCTHGTWVRDNT